MGIKSRAIRGPWRPCLISNRHRSPVLSSQPLTVPYTPRVQRTTTRFIVREGVPLCPCRSRVGNWRKSLNLFVISSFHAVHAHHLSPLTRAGCVSERLGPRGTCTAHLCVAVPVHLSDIAHRWPGVPLGPSLLALAHRAPGGVPVRPC